MTARISLSSFNVTPAIKSWSHYLTSFRRCHPSRRIMWLFGSAMNGRWMRTQFALMLAVKQCLAGYLLGSPQAIPKNLRKHLNDYKSRDFSKEGRSGISLRNRSQRSNGNDRRRQRTKLGNYSVSRSMP